MDENEQLVRTNKTNLLSRAFALFMDHGKDRAISGMWIAKVTKNAKATSAENDVLISSVRKFTFKLFDGKDATLDFAGAKVSVAPNITLLNKISLDLVETNKGQLAMDVYKYLRMVLPTIDNSEINSEGYYKMDIFSSFYNAWLNFYDKVEIMHFLDPIKKYRGPYWRFQFHNLKLDGSSGVIGGENNLDYVTRNLINKDLNLYYDTLYLDFVDTDGTITKVFKVDFNESLNSINNFA